MLNKKDLYVKMEKLLDGTSVHLDNLFDYFSSDDLTGFYKHLLDEYDEEDSDLEDDEDEE